MGAVLAFLLDKGVKGEGMFRAIYLFPMAVSFIAAGVVWRWLMNPAPGDRSTGFNLLFDKLGLGFLGNEWYLGRTWGAAALAIPACGRSPATSWRCSSRDSAACPRSFARRREWTAPRSGGCTGTSSSRI